MSEVSIVVSLWKECLEVLQELKSDVKKNGNEKNVAAGVRMRRKLRILRTRLSLLIKESLERDNKVVSRRKAKSLKLKTEA